MAVLVEFPAGRTRFNTVEALRILGIPAGSKTKLLELAADAGIRVETIGKARTYSRADIRRMAELRAARRRDPARPIA